KKNSIPIPIATFTYDGDGRRVKSVVGGVTTTFVGVHYQIINGNVTKYYFAGVSRIAMRAGSTLTYLLGDHLGSTSLTTDSSGNLVSELRYKPWGETRYSSGTTTTSYRYTGQREEAGFGLYFYNARWMDPVLGRFVQADTLVPGGVQGLDRYAYVLNNPMRYHDPSGHAPECDDGPQTWTACRQQLHDYANSTLEELGGVDDLEAVVRIVDKAAQLYKNYDNMIPALSGIFLGIEESNSLTIWHAFLADRCAALGRADCEANTVSFGDAGFNHDFQDGQSQPFHFWAYLATSANTEGTGPASYMPGAIISAGANVVHEIIMPDGAGATWQDYALAQAGINIGTLVNVGAVTPDQLGNTIKDYVGTNGPGAYFVPLLIQIMPLEGNRQLR
ncbi:MAG: RHS repeat-associated core domain-containing protein, partial [Chloroflexota bacterium]